MKFLQDMVQGLVLPQDMEQRAAELEAPEWCKCTHNRSLPKSREKVVQQ